MTEWRGEGGDNGARGESRHRGGKGQVYICVCVCFLRRGCHTVPQQMDRGK